MLADELKNSLTCGGALIAQPSGRQTKSVHTASHNMDVHRGNRIIDACCPGYAVHATR
jgi:hypothetical protein